MEVKRGRPAIGKNPGKAELRRLYVKKAKSMREIAAHLGLHPDTIHYWLKKYEIKTRSMAKRSKLKKFKLATLQRGIREKGVRGYANELGVHENTLRNYLKSIEEVK